MKRLLHKLLQSLKSNGRDWAVFLMSLLLAFSIWMIHNLSLNYSEFIRVPMYARCNIEGHSDISANSCEVVARCRTSGYNILKSRTFWKKNPVTIDFDRAGIQPKSGEMYYITRKELNESAHLLFGEKVSVEYFISDTLVFRFPYENFKKVPVFPVQVIEFKPQHMSLGELSIEPDSVTIYGEPYHLENVDRVFTEPIKLSDLSATTAGAVRIDKMKGVRCAEQEVHYSIDVTRYVEVVSEVQIGVENVPADKELMVYPSKAEIVYRCVFPLVSDLENTRFYIDYNDFITSRSRKCIPKVDVLPEGVIRYDMHPEVFDCVLNEK